MDPEDRRLLIDIHGKVSAIQPSLDSLASGQKGLEERQRQSELTQATHGVKIERLQTDVDGAFRKIKSVEDRSRIAVKANEHGSGWLKVVEVVADAPKWVHAILTVGSLATTAGVIIWRHWPR